MIKAHVDFPSCRVTVHRNPNCSLARVGPGAGVRHVLVNPDTVSRELNRFRDGDHRFAAAPPLADMWLILDFVDAEFEEALARHIVGLLALHHEEMRRCRLEVHDPCTI